MKRDPRLRGLSSDHHQALVLAQLLRRASTPEERALAAATLVERFERELEPHFRLEELRLLPALREVGEHAMVERTEIDHAYLREGVARVKRGEEVDLRAYGTRLDAHVRFEERELFERAQACLSSSVLDEIGVYGSIGVVDAQIVSK